MMTLLDMLLLTKLAVSKRDARQLIVSGGIYVNEKRVTDPRAYFVMVDGVIHLVHREN